MRIYINFLNRLVEHTYSQSTLKSGMCNPIKLTLMDLLQLGVCVGFPYIGSIAGSSVIIKNLEWYKTLKKPKCTPPPWFFGPIWGILYGSMGLASFFLLREAKPDAITTLSLAIYFIHLLLNWSWPHVFFGLHKLKTVSTQKKSTFSDIIKSFNRLLCYFLVGGGNNCHHNLCDTISYSIPRDKYCCWLYDDAQRVFHGVCLLPQHRYRNSQSEELQTQLSTSFLSIFLYHFNFVSVFTPLYCKFLASLFALPRWYLYAFSWHIFTIPHVKLSFYYSERVGTARELYCEEFLDKPYWHPINSATSFSWREES